MLPQLQIQEIEKIYEYVYKLSSLQIAEQEHSLPDNAYVLKSKITQDLTSMLNRANKIMAGWFRSWVDDHGSDLMVTTLLPLLSRKEKVAYGNYQKSAIKKNKQKFLKECIHTTNPTIQDGTVWSTLLCRVFDKYPKLKNKYLGDEVKEYDEERSSYGYMATTIVHSHFAKNYGGGNWYTWNTVFNNPDLKHAIESDFDSLIDKFTDMEIFQVMNFNGTDQKLITRYEKKMLDKEKDAPEDTQRRYYTYNNVKKALDGLTASESQSLDKKTQAFNLALTTSHNNGDMAEGFLEGAEEEETDVLQKLDELSNKDTTKWDKDIEKVVWRNPREVKEEDEWFEPESFLSRAVRLLLR